MASERHFQARQVADNVFHVGAIDWNLRNFHGYRTERGSTYNAFLVIDEKVTLIDTVKAPFVDELMERVASVIDPAKIDYIISNHAEMDHSGALPEVIRRVHPEKVFASPMGVRALNAHFGAIENLETVKTGDVLNIGKGTFRFVETKMLHWPDSMVSYLDSAKMLFSQDAFGMHYATSELFAANCDRSILRQEARKYFANILLHLAPRIIELLDNLPSLGLDIDILAPDHGPLWRGGDEIKWILDLYRECAEQKPAKRALLLYDTMWGSTAKLMMSVADGLMSSDVPVKVASLQTIDRSGAITELLGSGILVVGSPTMNNQIFPSLGDVMTYFKGLKPRNRIGGAVGSFGWSGEAPKLLQAALTEMGFDMPCAPLAVKYVPTDADLNKAFDFGASLAAALNDKMK